MLNFNRPRLNISNLNLSALEGIIAAYPKPMPFMRIQAGVDYKLFPLVSKNNWIQSVLADKKILTHEHWQNQKPILVSQSQYRNHFVILRGNESDRLALVGIKPKKINAVKVDIPAVIIKNGKRIIVDINDYLISTEFGDKFCIKNAIFTRLFATDFKKACELDNKIGFDRTVERGFSFK